MTTGLPEYNGWAGGYPTWCVNLWLSNTEGMEIPASIRQAARRLRLPVSGLWAN